MRYLFILFGSCLHALAGLAQDFPTVTLVFASTTNDTYKPFEAVIDGVSYYSEITTVRKNKKSTESVAAVDCNIIWLNDFQPGKHSIEVYNIKNGSQKARTGNSPVHASTFVVKQGFDTRITVTNNGKVQFSERASAGDIPGVVSEKNNKKSTDKRPRKNVYQGSSTKNMDQKNEDSYNSQNTDITERHSRKRIDTAIIMGNGDGDTKNTGKDRNYTMKGNDDDNNVNNAPHQINDNGRMPMDDDQFTQLYEKLRNQWHPGQRMKTLTNEFSTGGNNFTTSQAKQLLKLLTEEGNRLKLAKSSYQHISDPENFSEMDEILHYKASRKELDNFVKEEQN